MARSKPSKHDVQQADPQRAPKRKRKRRARTEVSSSESSSDSSDNETGGSSSNTKTNTIALQFDDDDEAVDATTTTVDVSMTDAPVMAAAEEENDDDDDDTASDSEPFQKKNIPNPFKEKAAGRHRIPSPVRNLHDKDVDARFEEYYLKLITEEFGDELNELRHAKDFGDKSLPMLIRALKSGANIFSQEERRTVLGER